MTGVRPALEAIDDVGQARTAFGQVGCVDLRDVAQADHLGARAGPGTKVVCLGNIAQIDTPYLTEGSSGLTYVVDRFKGWPHSGHITLQRGERSRLADHAAEVL